MSNVNFSGAVDTNLIIESAVTDFKNDLRSGKIYREDNYLIRDLMDVFRHRSDIEKIRDFLIADVGKSRAKADEIIRFIPIEDASGLNSIGGLIDAIRNRRSDDPKIVEKFKELLHFGGPRTGKFYEERLRARGEALAEAAEAFNPFDDGPERFDQAILAGRYARDTLYAMKEAAVIGAKAVSEVNDTGKVSEETMEKAVDATRDGMKKVIAIQIDMVSKTLGM